MISENDKMQLKISEMSQNLSGKIALQSHYVMSENCNAAKIKHLSCTKNLKNPDLSPNIETKHIFKFIFLNFS